MGHTVKGEDITTSKGRTEKRVNVLEQRLQPELVLYCSLLGKNCGRCQGVSVLYKV